MSLLMIPVVIALALKLGVLRVAHKTKEKSESLFSFVAAFTLLNACELMLFLNFDNDGSSEWLMRCYYSLSVFVLAFGISYAFEVSSGETNRSGRQRTLLWVPPALITAFVFFSDIIIAGANPTTTASTAALGEHYWIFQVYSFASIVAIASLLWRGYRNGESERRKIQCMCIMIAFTPLLMTAAAILTLMGMGIDVNALSILPIASSLFLLIVIYGERYHYMTDLSRLLPYSAERIMVNEMLEVACKYASEDFTHKETMDELNKLVIVFKQNKYKGNIMQTAKSMDVSRSTLYSMLKRYDIPNKRNS